MDILLPLDFKDFLKLLNDKEVEYLLIGGYAVAYHGYPHATKNKLASGRFKDLNDLENLP
jgi:hypothetical protein